MKRLKLKAIVFVSILGHIVLLAGCATNYVQPTANVDDPLLKKTLVFAKMEKDSTGSYSFTEFSLKNEPNRVLLNNLSHTYPVSQRECSKGLASTQDPLCSSDETIFRGKIIDAGDVAKNTLGNAVAGLFTYGLALSAYYTTEFDGVAYQKALDNALARFDRKLFIENVDDLITSSDRRVEEINRQITSQKKTLGDYLVKNTKVIDKSGLYTGEVPSVAVIGNEMPDNIVRDGVATFNDIHDLQRKIEQRLSNITGSYSMRLRCAEVPGFNCNISGDQQEFSYGQNSAVPVEYTINSIRDLRLLVEPMVKDSVLSVKVDNRGILTLENNSTEYVAVKAVSLYFEKEIETLEINIELPPMSVKDSLRISDFRHYSRHLELKNVSRKDLERQFDYALAVKYVVLDTNKEKTLFAKFNNRLKELRRI